MEGTIQPFWRGIFTFFFVHDLFFRISARGKERDLAHTWNPGHMASAFAMLFIAELYLIYHVLYIEGFASIMLLRWLLIFLTVAPLVPVQILCNRLNNDPKGKQNSNFTPVNIIWILLGSVVWILNGLGVWVSFLHP